jgi:hypothetical protein
MNGLPSFHDDFLVSYEVDCEARRIRLRAKPDGRVEANRGLPARAIIFEGVEGYQFENDAFGNIIFSLECISVERLLAAYGSKIAESFRQAGAPGPWAADIAAAAQFLKTKGVQAFELSSSYGLSGWILAKEVLVEQA